MEKIIFTSKLCYFKNLLILKGVLTLSMRVQVSCKEQDQYRNCVTP